MIHHLPPNCSNLRCFPIYIIFQPLCIRLVFFFGCEFLLILIVLVVASVESLVLKLEIFVPKDHGVSALVLQLGCHLSTDLYRRRTRQSTDLRCEVPKTGAYFILGFISCEFIALVLLTGISQDFGSHHLFTDFSVLLGFILFL